MLIELYNNISIVVISNININQLQFLIKKFSFLKKSNCIFHSIISIVLFTQNYKCTFEVYCHYIFVNKLKIHVYIYM